MNFNFPGINNKDYKMKKSIIVTLTVIAFCLVAEAQVQTGENIAIATTESGKVRGYIRSNIFVYKGIPYAEANRFEAPHKPKSWNGTRSSLTWGPVAYLETPTTSINDEPEFMYDHDFGYASEDCFRLNIWTPAINDGKKRPVMFWIHGGGYTVGSSQELPSYDGENLARKGDVVVVTINHRLNVLGFLDLSAYGEKYKYSANNSILDIRFALEWVKNNIAGFGGDPANVTIFGQSGGGGKVNALMAMPSAKGLFSKAINQSGAYQSSFFEKKQTQAVGDLVLQVLNIHPKNIDTIQKIPFQVLSDAARKAIRLYNDKLRAEGIAGARTAGWGPGVDGDLFPYQVLSKEAVELSKNVPLLIGTVKNESVTSLSVNLSNGTEAQIMEYIRNRWKDKTDAYVAAVKKAYPADTKPSDLIDIDFRFRPGAIAQANQKSQVAGGAPVYMYFFGWQSPALDGKYKAWHCMELPFVFDNIEKCQQMTGGGKDAYKLAEKISTAWISFAKTGNPNHKGLPLWESYNTNKYTTMYFDNVCKIIYNHDKELMELVTAVNR
jgi:para-nitrobenzyl esterase